MSRTVTPLQIATRTGGQLRN